VSSSFLHTCTFALIISILIRTPFFAVESCSIPMSLVGGKGSYRKVNPQLLQTVTSLKAICQSLNRAPDYWWKTATSDATLSVFPTEFSGNVPLDEDDQAMLDLQQGEEEIVDFQTGKDDMVDMQSEDMEGQEGSNDDDSEWEN
jgi:hypothetical protein